MTVSLERQRRRTPDELRQAWAENGDSEPQHERVHGKFETVELYSWQFVKLSQIRGEKNPISQDLKESIIATGLMNPIDVAQMTQEQLDEYIQFTNETWGSEAQIEDFGNQIQDDGLYYVLISGHSRHEAIDEAEQEGSLYPIPIQAKKHPVNEVEDIIELQDAENKHSRPKQERAAMAAVEAYEWGKKQGRWSTPDEFIERYRGKNKVDAKTLSEALCYQLMPRDVRQFVVESAITYVGGVELGKSVELTRDFIATKSGYLGLKDPRLIDEESEDAVLLQKAVTQELMKQANFISVKKLNSTASKKYIEGQRGTMRGFLVKERKQDSKEPAFNILQDVDARSQLEAEVRNIRRAISQVLTEISKRPAAEYKTLFELNKQILGTDKLEELIENLTSSLKNQLRQIGGVAMQNEVEIVDLQESLF
ncbi:MAG: hypothetical protein JWN75_283 [Candidatus Saccharibacteria bacterium]|nr:hypothetical protein [Candidatus Saccharibacteria bacterium]